MDTILTSSCSVDSPQVVWTTPIPWVMSRGTHYMSRGHMLWTTPTPWVTSRGEHMSRGCDIPWTTCTHGTQGCCPRDMHAVDCVPWVVSVLLM